ncbi:glucokinase [Desulfovibrio mangrovi]|uniref:glucokinase n=1 Tax=Desulfovibrio mangrovi TaxID=2976983 RepID=UPI0022480F3C|nr:glucokinase [Desulfovibrio mangrovi]UZP67948.1 glucokinase [Desulfovibrio mangrovi]
MKRILVADIGGTNSRFAAFTHSDGELRREASVWLSTTQAASFEQLLEQLAASSLPCSPHTADAIVLAVAGPVEHGKRAALPNIAWDLDLRTLPASCGCANALLVNDFLAQAYACLSPAMREATPILSGTPVADAPIAILGAGTGFGHALLIEVSPGQYKAIPSEGGHAHFPFIGPEENAFADFLRKETGRPQVIGDMVVSGSGIRNLHTFFTGERLPSREVTSRLTQASPELALFARFLGRACHDFVLKTLALGGLVITGGVASGNPCIVRHPAFAEAFLDSDTHGHLLRNIPVHLNTNEEFGLWGAAQLAVMHLNRS